MKMPKPIIIKREDLPKRRIPLPKKIGGVHIPKTEYRRKRSKDELRRETREFLN
ncbi:MAG: hypothetical protein AAB784_02520 [Patescibacteria group bacterium]